MLKVELHTHTSDDPLDRIRHTSFQLIDRAAALGYDALAITLHDRQLDITPLIPYAAERGLTLIPGIERTIHGKHVLLLNFARGAEDVRSFEDVSRLKAQDGDGIVIAPHPYFPLTSCLWGLMDRHADLWDAVEVNAMFTTIVNFNRPAERWARLHSKPLVGNGDVHVLRQLGTTYSLVDAERDPASICAAVAAGRVEVVSQPLAWTTAARLATRVLTLGNAPASPRGTRQPSPA